MCGPFHEPLLLVSEGTLDTLSECPLDRVFFWVVIGPVRSRLGSKLRLIGEPGAYISANGARSAGDVRAENN